ncbi:MAG: rod shape-determining protein MreC [Anaerolineae bacterium]|nr:rod shape-determining protein MreC [Anaerolineae bacterium]
MKGLRNWPVLVVALAASVVILLVGSTGALRPVDSVASVVVVPIQYALHRAIEGLGNLLRMPYDLQHLRAENQRLQMQVDELVYQLALRSEIELENAALRELLDLRERSPDILGPEADLLSAEVIGWDPSNLLRYLTIDRGSRDGVKAGMPVITARGLVGQVREVRANSAKVVLLTDPSSGVNALVQRSRATGIVEGQTGPNLVLRYLPQTEGIAQPGDLVLTSGLGGHFPRRLLIGEVTEVKRSDVEMFQEARLRPAVDFDRLEIVFVVRHFTPIGVEAQADRAAEPAGGTQ